jgi:hypothetical protein
MSAWPFFIANKASPPQGKNIFEITINVYLACSKQPSCTGADYA